jgi:hypothetical protein
MASSFHRIDLVEVLERCHRPPVEVVPKQQSQKRSWSDYDIDSDGNGLLNGDDNASTTTTTTTSFVTTTSGWDETILDQDIGALASWQQRQAGGKFLTPHAMAVQSFVYGTEVYRHHYQPFQQDDDHIDKENLQIRWKTSLAPNRVYQIASNEDGTIIAATTDNGAISLLRGRDGKVLATRRLTTPMTTLNREDSVPVSPSSWGPQVSFVKSCSLSSQHRGSSRIDALLVQIPASNHPALLVSNIQGERLNDANQSIVAQATQSMNLDTIQIPTIPLGDILVMEGYYHHNAAIVSNNLEGEDLTNNRNTVIFRFVFIHQGVLTNGEKRLALAEYNAETQECHLLLSKNVFMTTYPPSISHMNWEVDERLGLHLHPLSCSESYLLASVAHSANPPTERKTKICWLDPDESLTDTESLGVCDQSPVRFQNEYTIPKTIEDGSSEVDEPLGHDRVVAFSLLHSCDAKKAIAFAITLRGEKQTKTQVLQVQVLPRKSPLTVDSRKSVTLGPVHLIYSVPLPVSPKSMSLCPLDQSLFGPYSFRAKVSFGWNIPEEAFVFRTSIGYSQSDPAYHDGSSIGSIRLHTMANEFGQARAVVHTAGMEMLLQDEFAHFHPAEISLQRLKHSLLVPDVGEEILQESFMAFERGSGHVHGQRALLGAADFLLHWPAERNESVIPNYHPMPRISKVGQTLSSFIRTMKNVSDIFLDQDTPPSITLSFHHKLGDLQNKLETMQYLEDSLGKECDKNDLYVLAASMNDLFDIFLKDGDFDSAGRMLRSLPGTKVSTEQMVNSIFRIPSHVEPHRYIHLLKEYILPSLSINHELLPSILTWACSKADKLDDDMSGAGIDHAIFLMEAVEQATKQLRLKVHASFAYYSPFIDRPFMKDSSERLLSTKEKRSLADTSSGYGSVGESFMSDLSTNTLDNEGQSRAMRSLTNSDSNSTNMVSTRSNPTILEIARMKRGAQKTSGQASASLEGDTVDEYEELLEAKLEAGRWLKEARLLGLGHNLVTLRNFAFCGGSSFLCKELIRYYSSKSETCDQRQTLLRDEVLKFCNRSRVDYDGALKNYAIELCGGTRANPEAIEEAASIARCCCSPTTKCQITLITLRSALFCRFSPVWLTKLSRDAIEWAAGDSSIRLELEEASRLLLIDEIVGRYCGNGAKELFHVDNPIHASRLLEFVSNNFRNKSVLADVLNLCDAFHHLSVEDGCGILLQNTILRGQQEQVTSLLEELYIRNKTTAHNVYSRVMTFCIDLIDDYTTKFCTSSASMEDAATKSQKNDIIAFTLCALNLTKVALFHSREMVSFQTGSGFTPLRFSAEHLEKLIKNLERIKTLQTEYDIFLRLSDLDRPGKIILVATKLLSDIVKYYKTSRKESANAIASQTRRVCELLAPGLDSESLDETSLLFIAAITSARDLAWTSDGLESIDLLSDLGILAASNCEIASRCCLSLSMTYCLRSAKQSGANKLMTNMKAIVIASSILQDYTLLKCKNDVLGSATSLCVLSDIISRVLIRADEGCGEELDVFRRNLLEKATEKRWTFASLSVEKTKNNNIEELVNLVSPTFHPTWYVGDGLLLPPEEAMRKGIDYCKQIMGLQIMDDPSMGIEAFVVNRGCRALGLQLLSHSVTTQICLSHPETPFELLNEFNYALVISLAERYLGGTGAGMTNGLVDSQLAMSHLVSLPLKVAFKLYRSSLPTAISTRQFARVICLAMVGKVSGTIETMFGIKVNGTWRRQSKFVNQCDNLATNACWWCILDEHNIRFDPRMFEDNPKRRQSLGASNGLLPESTYIGSLMPKLINASSEANESAEHTLELIRRCSLDFSLPPAFPVSCYVQYLLCPAECRNSSSEIRSRVSELEGIVRRLLLQLDLPLQRLEILRTCLINFEDQVHCTDYERLSIILSLYQAEMSHMISGGFGSNNNNLTDSYFIEMETIDRRRDALAILSSYYEGEKKDHRPSFSKFFLPLSKKIEDTPDRETLIYSNILGWESSCKDNEGFDPLKPLEATLRSSCDSAVAAALSPLCLPLGVPRGYIRGRTLIAKFQKSINEGAVLPPYEEVDSVLKLVRSNSDIADLAEWCSKQYLLDDPAKLMCLDHALEAAVKASNEAERNTRKGGGPGLEEQESTALARVKRVSTAKELLADRLAIMSILKKAWQDSDQRSSFAMTIQQLSSRLEEQVWNKVDVFVPEHFIDILFRESSKVACEASLDDHNSISVGQFRKLSLLTHIICDCIAERYSHVQIGHLARRLTSRWLLHGDEQEIENLAREDGDRIPMKKHSDHVQEIDEDDTVDFEMDLSKIQDESIWSSCGSSAIGKIANGKSILAPEEETSSLKPTSLRELSEMSTTRCALRIAFVMAFADGYHNSNVYEGTRNIEGNEENFTNIRPTISSKPKRRGLLSKVKASKAREPNHQHVNVLEHCRELLQLVFARSASAQHILKDLYVPTADAIINDPKKKASTTLTFAMRHRCLRIASILVPQEALEQVLRGDKFQISTSARNSLRSCAFGAFCAKELEEMQLPIPHPDLMQLSQMHFPSYARALWRHHRDIKGAKGRLLLLILELYLKEMASDFGFINTLMNEIGALHLPRTLFLAFESIERYVNRNKVQFGGMLFEPTNPVLFPMLSKMSKCISFDLKNTGCAKPNDGNSEDDVVFRRHATDTVVRFARVIICFSNRSGSLDLLIDYCQNLIEFVQGKNWSGTDNNFVEVIHHLIAKVESSETRKALIGSLDAKLR